MSDLVENILLLGVLYFAVLLITRLFRKRVRYIDTGDSETYFSKKYGISAKPDLILNGNTIVEKKSRLKGVYVSDRKQVIATALAVRSKYKITVGIVETQQDRVEIDLSGSDAELFKSIEKDYQDAISVKRGIPPAPSPSIVKCRGCQFNSMCEYAMR